MEVDLMNTTQRKRKTLALKMSGGRSDEDTVNLKIQFNKDGVQTLFRIKRSTKLQKLMEAFCKNRSLDPKSIEFTFDSVRLEKNKTPEQLGMEDGDLIDALVSGDGA